MAGRPTPRQPKVRPSGPSVALLALMLALLLSAALMWSFSHDLPTEAEQRSERLVTHDSMTATHTYDGEAIRWYVMTDPDTGIQYVVNDRGGCCPRLDRYGSVMGIDYGE